MPTVPRHTKSGSASALGYCGRGLIGQWRHPGRFDTIAIEEIKEAKEPHTSRHGLITSYVRADISFQGALSCTSGRQLSVGDKLIMTVEKLPRQYPSTNSKAVSPNHNGPFGKKRLAIVAAAAAFLLPPALIIADSYEVFHEGIVRVGNRWEFDSVYNGTPYRMTWEILAGQPIGGQNTVLLRETGSPYYIDDFYVYLTGAALTVNQAYSTQYNPTSNLTSTFTDPLEKFPRVVNSTDNARNLGHGQWTVQVLQNPSQFWTRTQDQYVTFMGTEKVTVAAGTFDCVIFRVDEIALLSTGWREVAQRVYYMHPSCGPVAMSYAIQQYDQWNNPQGSYSITHALRSYTLAVPDLTLGSGAWFSPTLVRSGDSLTVSWTEFSRYRDIATTHSTTVYLTADTVISDSDFRLIDALPVSPIAADQSVTLTESAIVPSVVPSGNYRVAIVLDTLNEIEEMDENNTYFVEGTLTVVAEPDLTVSSGGFTPEAVMPGDALSISGTIVNAGGAIAPPVWTHVYLSTDTIIGATDYPLITGIQTPPLDPLAEHTFYHAAFVPLGFPEAVYYVGIEVDVNNALPEADETNNTLALPFPVIVGGPDLRIVSGSFSPAAVTVGMPVRVQARIDNAGPRAAASNWIHLYLSADRVITPTDTLLQSGLRAPQLVPGGAVTVDANPTIPPGTPLGSYYVGVIVDVLNEIAEINKGNNAQAIGSGRLLVTTPPDLRAHNLDFAPGVVNGGDAIILVGFIQNVTGLPAEKSFWVEFYVSPNPDFSPPRYFLCDSVSVPALGMGETFLLSSLQRTVYAGIPPGEYTFGVVVDRPNDIVESDETNNTTWVSGKSLYINMQPTRASRWHLYR